MGNGIREFKNSLSGDKDDDSPEEKQRELQASQQAQVSQPQPPQAAARTRRSQSRARSSPRKRPSQWPGCGRSTSRTGSRSSNISTSYGRASSFRSPRSRVAFGALLLAEQPAARHRQRAAARRQDADHLRGRRAVHHDGDDHRLRGAGDLAAGDPLPGLRVRLAGAHDPREAGRRPLPDGVPLLFLAGVVFGYFVVLPAATKFLLNFNDSQFNIQIRARDYYSFFTLTLAVMGLVFQLPIGILAVTRLGIVTPAQLSENRRYAYVIIADRRRRCCRAPTR